jgi:uncharacterized protein
MSKHGDFCWNELMTSDVEKAKAFYKALFNWEYQEVGTNTEKYTMIKTAGGDGGGGIMQTPADKQGQIPPHWMTYINVDNIDESVAKATSLGANVKVPATDVQDYGRFAIITDPTGAHVGMWQSLKSCGSCG